MKNDIITVFGKKGSGKTFLIRNKIVPFYHNNGVIILDTMHEYTFRNGFIATNANDVLDILEKYEAVDKKNFIISLQSGEFDDYLTTLSFIHNFRGVTLVVDEVDKFAEPATINTDLKNLFNVGRHYEINLIAASRRPNQVNRIVTSQSDLLVMFSLQEPRDLAYIRQFSNKEVANFVKALKIKEHKYEIYGDSRLAKDIGI